MAFFTDAQWQNKRQEAQTETQEAPPEHATLYNNTMVIPALDVLKYVLKDTIIHTSFIAYYLPSTFILFLLEKSQNEKNLRETLLGGSDTSSGYGC